MARGVLLAFAVLAIAACGGADEPAAPVEVVPELPVTEAAPEPRPEPPEPEPAPEPEPEPEPEPPEPEPEPEPEPLPGLPQVLAGYETWTRLNAEPIAPRSPDPHLGTKNVYASEPAAGGTYPDGTIVVKDSVRPGRDFVGLVAMMRKERGAQPDHNDWVWIEWVRDGPDEPFRELARDAVCYGCHVGASETDYVFTQR